jgi:hypothetical protein
MGSAWRLHVYIGCAMKDGGGGSNVGFSLRPPYHATRRAIGGVHDPLPQRRPPLPPSAIPSFSAPPLRSHPPAARSYDGTPVAMPPVLPPRRQLWTRTGIESCEESERSVRKMKACWARLCDDNGSHAKRDLSLGIVSIFPPLWSTAFPLDVIDGLDQGPDK